MTLFDGKAIVRSWALGTLAQDHPNLSAEQRRAIGLIASGSVDEKALDAAGPDFVRAVKAAPGFARNLYSVNGPLLTKAPEGAPFIPWVFSTQATDRDGSIVMQDGWDLDNYRKNPVIDWAHSWARGRSEEPYARGENLRTETVGNVQALVGDIFFAVQESEDGARRYRLAKSGFINAGSVGFSNLETKYVEDEEERNRLGLGRFGVVHVRHELLEFSLCTVPAHPDAVQRALKDAVSSGAIEEKDAELAVALSDPTEKEWEKRARQRQRAFVDMGRAKKAHEESNDATAKALQANAEANHRLADSLEMLAKSITYLSEHVGRVESPDGGPPHESEGANGKETQTPELAAIEAARKGLRGMTQALKGAVNARS